MVSGTGVRDNNGSMYDESTLYSCMKLPRNNNCGGNNKMSYKFFKYLIPPLGDTVWGNLGGMAFLEVENTSLEVNFEIS